MGVLHNSKHELFAQELAKGATCEAAYVTAGYAANPGNSRRLKGTEAVLKRVEELKAEGAAIAVAAIGVTLEAVIGELAKIGFSDIRKVIRWAGHTTEIGQEDEEGVPVLRTFNQVALIDSDKIDEATAAAISEISQTKDGALKVKLYDKKGALVDLGRHLGAFKDKVELSADDSWGAMIDALTAKRNEPSPAG